MGVLKRGDFNIDITKMLNTEQLGRLEAELGILNDPVEKAMPSVKDKMRQQIVSDLQAKKNKVSNDDIQGLLKLNAAEDLDEMELM